MENRYYQLLYGNTGNGYGTISQTSDMDIDIQYLIEDEASQNKIFSDTKHKNSHYALRTGLNVEKGILSFISTMYAPAHGSFSRAQNYYHSICTRIPSSDIALSDEVFEKMLKLEFCNNDTLSENQRNPQSAASYCNYDPEPYYPTYTPDTSIFEDYRDEIREILTRLYCKNSVLVVLSGVEDYMLRDYANALLIYLYKYFSYTLRNDFSCIVGCNEDDFDEYGSYSLMIISGANCNARTPYDDRIVIDVNSTEYPQTYNSKYSSLDYDQRDFIDFVCDYNDEVAQFFTKFQLFVGSNEGSYQGINSLIDFFTSQAEFGDRIEQMTDSVDETLAQMLKYVEIQRMIFDNYYDRCTQAGADPYLDSRIFDRIAYQGDLLRREEYYMQCRDLENRFYSCTTLEDVTSALDVNTVKIYVYNTDNVAPFDKAVLIYGQDTVASWVASASDQIAQRTLSFVSAIQNYDERQRAENLISTCDSLLDGYDYERNAIYPNRRTEATWLATIPLFENVIISLREKLRAEIALFDEIQAQRDREEDFARQEEEKRTEFVYSQETERTRITTESQARMERENQENEAQRNQEAAELNATIQAQFEQMKADYYSQLDSVSEYLWTNLFAGFRDVNIPSDLVIANETVFNYEVVQKLATRQQTIVQLLQRLMTLWAEDGVECLNGYPVSLEALDEWIGSHSGGDSEIVTLDTLKKLSYNCENVIDALEIYNEYYRAMHTAPLAANNVNVNSAYRNALLRIIKSSVSYIEIDQKPAKTYNILVELFKAQNDLYNNGSLYIPLAVGIKPTLEAIADNIISILEGNTADCSDVFVVLNVIDLVLGDTSCIHSKAISALELKRRQCKDESYACQRFAKLKNSKK
ncbi:MAG: hypothetical protein IKA82_01845 [Clostridia bacterium]|nr:hypothetical protein [Clostridia bacterium]